MGNYQLQLVQVGLFQQFLGATGSVAHPALPIRHNVMVLLGLVKCQLVAVNTSTLHVYYR